MRWRWLTEASPAVRAQLIPGVTDAGKGARGVSAAMGTPCLSRLTFIDVCRSNGERQPLCYNRAALDSTHPPGSRQIELGLQESTSQFCSCTTTLVLDLLFCWTQKVVMAWVWKSWPGLRLWRRLKGNGCCSILLSQASLNKFKTEHSEDTHTQTHTGVHMHTQKHTPRFFPHSTDNLGK